MNLQVSSSPHIRDNSMTSKIMLDVIIALLPAVAASVYFFGFRSLSIISVTVGVSLITEYICRKLMKRYNSVYDLSAVVTGLLLALSLPPTIPLWICALGAFIAIAVAKQMFGGIGSNFVNPAIGARIILTVSFPAQMSTWTIREGSSNFMDSLTGADLLTTATPLALLSNDSDLQTGATYVTEVTATLPTYLETFLGFKGGCIGEISIAALLIGALYLLLKGIIKIWIPLSFIGTTIIITTLAGYDPLYHLLSGGLVIGAFFMATDYVTSPLTNKGKILFGFGCGLLTGLIRVFGYLPEGVSFAIIIMNILTPHIDKITIPKPFGGGKKIAG